MISHLKKEKESFLSKPKIVRNYKENIKSIFKRNWNICRLKEADICSDKCRDSKFKYIDVSKWHTRMGGAEEGRGKI